MHKREFKKLSSLPKELRWIGDPILIKKTKNVLVKDIRKPETKRTTNKIISVLKKIQKLGIGVALASNQIGISKSIIVVNIDGEYFPFINPRITKYSKNKNIYPEGCLSFLPLVADTIRPESISVSYYCAAGKQHKEKFDGAMARILQHEIDHLNGILCIERADMKTARYIFDWKEFKKKAKLKEVSINHA